MTIDTIINTTSISSWLRRIYGPQFEKLFEEQRMDIEKFFFDDFLPVIDKKYREVCENVFVNLLRKDLVGLEKELSINEKFRTDPRQLIVASTVIKLLIMHRTIEMARHPQSASESEVEMRRRSAMQEIEALRKDLNANLYKPDILNAFPFNKD